MKGITIGLLVAAGVAGLWAAQRATASRHAPATIASAQPGTTATSIPPHATDAATAQPIAKDPIDPRMVRAPKGGSDPKMVITPKDNIDPKIVINPPPPRSPEDKSALKPRPDH
jgi:hypothetical protein